MPSVNNKITPDHVLVYPNILETHTKVVVQNAYETPTVHQTVPAYGTNVRIPALVLAAKTLIAK